MWRVYAPAGSTWRARAASNTAITAGETYAVTIFTSATVDGAYLAVAGGAASVTNASGTSIVTGTTVTPSAGSDVYLTIRCTYTAIAGILANSYIGILERVS